MVTKTYARKDNDSYSYDASNISSKKKAPWCSGKLTERRKLSPDWEIQSSYPLRENIWEYLHNGENLKCRNKRLNRETNKKVKCCGKKMKLVLMILLCMMGMIVCITQIYPTQSFKLINKMVRDTKMFMNKRNNLSVSDECCDRMRHLASELSRKQQLLSVYRHTVRLSKMPTAKVDWVTEDYMAINNLEVSIGKDTKEWGGLRRSLWGILPLWQASPSPNIVLSSDIPQAGNCWPFSGSSGSLHMLLPGHLAVRTVSLEHVRPDTAKSAPERFEVVGIRADGVAVGLVESVYRREGPAKQYFPVITQDKLIDVIFYVKSNHGNPNYTCIYRIQLYTSTKDYNEGFWQNI